MRKEARRWLRQAESDLRAARNSLKSGSFEWSCFQSQQSGEKALKSLLYGLGYTSLTTHSLKILSREAAKRIKSFSKLSKEARTLDAYYIPTRYPNGLAGDVAPADYYDREDAEQCLCYAASILSMVKKFAKA